MSESVSVTITQQKDYQFLVDFGAALPQLTADEPAPIGQGNGPDPTQMLLAAVANCLSASLLFALKKFKQDAGGISATATCRMERNAENRLRVAQIDVAIRLGKPGQAIENIARILAQFEAFCTVSQSVQTGVPVQTSVCDVDGVVLG